MLIFKGFVCGAVVDYTVVLHSKMYLELGDTAKTIKSLKLLDVSVLIKNNFVCRKAKT